MKNKQNNAPLLGEEPDFLVPDHIPDNGKKTNTGAGKKRPALVVVLIVAVLLCGVFLCWKKFAHTHIWLEATCMIPRTCGTCGKTEGSVRDHVMMEATCEMPRMCQFCGFTEGAPREHNWNAATNVVPASCSDCGIEEGRSLGYPLVLCKVLEDTNYVGGQNKDIAVGNWEDTYGGTHRDSLRFWVANFGNFHEEEYIRYDLGAQFTQLDLTIAPEKESAKNTRSKIFVYCGAELLYESDWITTDMAPVFTTVTFAPCDELTILCRTDSPAYHYCIVNAVLYN